MTFNIMPLDIMILSLILTQSITMFRTTFSLKSLSLIIVGIMPFSIMMLTLKRITTLSIKAFCCYTVDQLIENLALSTS